MNKILSYKDLEVWKKSMVLNTLVYQITKDFPKEEVYGLTSQIRRASCSVSINIAEGSGRQTTNSFIQFLRISRGSLMELENCLIISKNLNYLSSDNYNKALSLTEEVIKMTNGLIKSLKTKLEKDSLTTKL